MKTETSTKQKRQVAILNLIQMRRLHTQQELTSALAEIGVDTTQATVSRDIQDLGLVRTRTGYKPVLFTDYIVAVESVQFLTVIRTNPGSASLVARAIDEREFTGVVGTVAGDDTIIIVHPSQAAAREFKGFLNA